MNDNEFFQYSEKELAEGTDGYYLPDPIPLNTAPTVPPFPVDALPPIIYEYVAGLAEETQVPPDMAASVVLGTLAACVSGKAKIRLRRRWSEHLCLYTVTAMDPGNRKSPVFQAARGPLGILEKELIAEAEPIISQAQAKKDFREATAQKLLRGKGEISEAEYEKAVVDAESIVVPAKPQLLADDATPEVIAMLADAQGGRLAITSDEGGIFENFNGRYSGKPNLDVFLKGWSGGETKVNRVGRPPVLVDNLTLTFILLVQPSILREIGQTSHDKTRGELERWLYSVPHSFIGYRNLDPADMPQELHDRYYQLVVDLGRRFYKAEEVLELSLTSAARARFQSVREKTEARLRPDGMLGNLRVRGWGAKLDGHIARIAGIFHIVSGRPGTQVDADLIDDADRLGDYYAQHALAAFHLMDASGVNPEAEAILTKIREHSLREFTRRDLMVKTGKKKDEVAGPLDLLVDHGWLDVIEPPETPGPGRKKGPIYRAHPLTFADRDPATNSTKSTQWAKPRDSVEKVEKVEGCEPEHPPVDSVDSVASLASVATPGGVDEADDEAAHPQPSPPQWGVNPNTVEPGHDLPKNTKGPTHKDYVLAYITEHGASSPKEIAAGLADTIPGFSPRKASVALDRLHNDDEAVTCTSRGVWDLTGRKTEPEVDGQLAMFPGTEESDGRKVS